MNLEEALKTALELEAKVRNLYRDAAEKVEDPVGRKIFRVLGEEEQSHLDFLSARYKEWRESGKVSAERIRTALPPREAIEENVKKLREAVGGGGGSDEAGFLSKALKLETETSGFYRRLLTELPEGDRGLFRGFAEVEDSHLALVQAELDHFANNGVYFDFMEFAL